MCTVTQSLASQIGPSTTTFDPADTVTVTATVAYPGHGIQYVSSGESQANAVDSHNATAC